MKERKIIEELQVYLSLVKWFYMYVKTVNTDYNP